MSDVILKAGGWWITLDNCMDERSWSDGSRMIGYVAILAVIAVTVFIWMWV